MLNTVLTVRAHEQIPTEESAGRNLQMQRSCSQRTGSADRVYSVGSAGTAQKTDAEQSEAFDP